MVGPVSLVICRVCREGFSGFGGLGVACCLEVPKFGGSNPAKAVRIFQGEKFLSMPSFRREVKPVGPMSQICGM